MSERIIMVNPSLISCHYPVAEIDSRIVEKSQELPTGSDPDFFHRRSDNSGDPSCIAFVQVESIAQNGRHRPNRHPHSVGNLTLGDLPVIHYHLLHLSGSVFIHRRGRAPHLGSSSKESRPRLNAITKRSTVFSEGADSP